MLNTRNTLTFLLAVFGLMLLGLLWAQGFPAYRSYIAAARQVTVASARGDLSGALIGLQRGRVRITPMEEGVALGAAQGDPLVTSIAALRRVSDTLSDVTDPDFRNLGGVINRDVAVLSGQLETLAAAQGSSDPRRLQAARDSTRDAITQIMPRLAAARDTLLGEGDSADRVLAGLQLADNSLLMVNREIQRDRAVLLPAFQSSVRGGGKSLQDAENPTLAPRSDFDVLMGTIELFDKGLAREMAGLFDFVNATYHPARAHLLQALSAGVGVASAGHGWLEAAAAFDRIVDGVREDVLARSQTYHAGRKAAALSELERLAVLSAAVLVLFCLSLFIIEHLVLRPVGKIHARILDLLAGDMTPKPTEHVTLGDLRHMSDAVRVFRVEAVRRERLSRDQMQLHERIAAAHNSLKADMRAAAKVQIAQMPEPGDIGKVRFSTFFEAAQEVAGDTFDYLPISDQRVGLFQIDVAGHGAAAGLVSVAAHIAARRTLRKLDPEESLAAAIGALNAGWSPDLTYFTMAAIELDAQRDRGRLVQAGHPHPVLMRTDGSVSWLGQGGLPIGVVPDAVFEDIVFPFAAGDRLFVFSDGLYENMNDCHELFTEARFIDLLRANTDCDTDTLVARIRDALKAWCGTGAFSDDVSLVVAERI